MVIPSSKTNGHSYNYKASKDTDQDVTIAAKFPHDVAKADAQVIKSCNLYDLQIVVDVKLRHHFVQFLHKYV